MEEATKTLDNNYLYSPKLMGNRLPNMSLRSPTLRHFINANIFSEDRVLSIQGSQFRDQTDLN